jgi:SAM-dependent methyltransferase
VDWENRYVAGDTPWNRGEAAPPLVDFLETEKIQGRILVPGCGLGFDVRALAAQGATVLGLDIAPTAITQAEAFPKAGDENYLLGDLFNLPAELEHSFDWVLEHTCYCAIDPSRRDDYLYAICKALKPGGQILGIFYTDPNPVEGPPFATTAAEIVHRFSPYFAWKKSWQPTRCYPGREGCEWVHWMEKKFE